MKVTKKNANEVVRNILGYIPKQMIENESTFEYYSWLIKVSIFKYMEDTIDNRDYKYTEIYDKENNKNIKYSGEAITAQIFIENEAKDILKFNKDLESIVFEYNDENLEL